MSVSASYQKQVSLFGDRIYNGPGTSISSHESTVHREINVHNFSNKFQIRNKI